MDGKSFTYGLDNYDDEDYDDEDWWCNHRSGEHWTDNSYLDSRIHLGFIATLS